jgi:molecular chaperone GrpE
MTGVLLRQTLEWRDPVVQKRQKNGWDRVARWAGIDKEDDKDNTKEEPMTTGDEVTMQDEEAIAQEPQPASQSGARTVRQAGEESGAEPIEPALHTPAHTQEMQQLRGEKDQLLDRLARLQAEFDNARKREMKERADAREYTIGSTVEPFLGVMDNFQLALKSEGTADQLRAGVELILKQMEEALKGLNVQIVETVGAQFDPRFHEALGSIETSEFPDHQVLEEIRRGYKIKEKLLRPALVRIAVNSAQVPA